MQTAMIDLRQRARYAMPDLVSCPRELVGCGVLTWRARMVNEYMSSRVFAALAAQLDQAQFGAQIVGECARFAEEERQHGVMCGAVVEALGEEAKAPLPERPPFPLHPGAPGRAAVLRNVIHVSCMSETVAVSLIGAERLEMPDGSLRDLLTRIYADEVGHARFGWRLLDELGSSLSDAERAAIERYLPLAFAHVEEHELLHLPNCDAPRNGALLGLCSGREARRLLAETIEEIIRPGLRRWFCC
jgi:hypothetical protein